MFILFVDQKQNYIKKRIKKKNTCITSGFIQSA